ncbi:MAG TPA: hypothetical protein DDW76_15245 [Cyanobacteria bacterium UBA11369]|nr:hypothetical protein [Cyanobacteria bacterium UBA11369]
MGEVKPFGFVCVAAPLRVPLHKQSRTSYGCKPLYKTDPRKPPCQRGALGGSKTNISKLATGVSTDI